MKLWHMGKTAPDIWGKGGVGALKRFGCHSSYPTSYPTSYPSSYPSSYPFSYLYLGGFECVRRGV